MKKWTIIGLLLSAASLLCGPGISPCLAYYPPLQDVTGPTVTQDTDTNVTVSVHNPATGQDIPHTWTIPGDATAITIDQTYNVQGIVAWRVTDTVNHQFKIYCAVYDPGYAALAGDPKWGWMTHQTYLWVAHDTNIIAVNDGVVVYETKYTSGQTKISVGIYTYDPSGWYEEMMGGWMPYSWRGASYTLKNSSGAAPRNYTVKDGVVAFVYDVFVDYAIFDGHLSPGGWQIANTMNSLDVTDLQITNATVTWTDNNGAQKRGYDYTSGSWISGKDTKVMAYFDFWPTPGKPNQPVWFTDMSIGATAWSWTLGDGGVSSGRSFYHKYSSAGSFVANLQVSGPAGDDANNKTVPVKATGSPGSLMLLLMDN